jgi:hypothetical protein
MLLNLGPSISYGGNLVDEGIQADTGYVYSTAQRKFLLPPSYTR